MRPVFVLAVAAALGAWSCERAGGAPSPATGTARQPVCGQASDETVRVMGALAPVCSGCHVTGTRAYFASVSAFQNLLVADTRLVKPGDPANSELMKLLRGAGSGPFKQMPIGTVTYAQLLARGEATLTFEQLEAWITGLASQARDARPDPRAARVTRLKAEQIQRVLYQQLGLSHDDFFIPASEFGIAMAQPISDDLYPFQPVDAVPKPRTVNAIDRHYALGGGSAIAQQRKDGSLSPTFTLTLTQVSQRWCRLALGKTTNPALFPSGTTRDPGEANVKATLRRWFRHFHGRQVGDAELDRVYRTVWVPLAAGSAEAAWVGACSSFIRHPDWIFY